MRRFVMTLASAVVIAVFLCGTGFAALREYTNGIDGGYSPFAYIDKAGQPAGFDVEAMNWVAAKMGFSVKHVARPWKGIIDDLLTGRVDMICSGMSITSQRAARVAFSEPYFVIRKVIVIRADQDLTGEQVLKSRKWLGVQRGTNEAEWLSRNRDRNKWNYELVYFDSPGKAMAGVLDGKVDAAGLDSAPAMTAIDKQGMNLKIVGEFAPKDEFGVAVRPGENELLKLINEGFRQLRADPFWEELWRKYLTPNE